MSANIPFEVQEEIIKRVLPVKSLIRFRSVSKQLKSLIESSEFITNHSVNQAQPQHLLVKYRITSEENYVSIVDDDSFPQHNFYLTVSPTLKLLRLPVMLGSSHGLVCLYCFDPDPHKDKELVVLWNPSIRKSIGIVLPFGSTVVGFGVCRKTSDPKIVTITRSNSPFGIHTTEPKAKVFILRSGAWRSVPMNLCCHHKSMEFSYNQVVIDGVIHWFAYDWITGSHHVIISFDLTSEEFGEIVLPDSLSHPSNLFITRLKGSLAVLNYNEAAPVCDVWMMIKNGDSKSWFTKLITVSFRGTYDSVFSKIIGFRNNGQPITEHICKRDDLVVTSLEIYELCSERNNDIGIYKAYDSLFMMTSYDPLLMMTSYTESLILLNHSSYIIR